MARKSLSPRHHASAAFTILVAVSLVLAGSDAYATAANRNETHASPHRASVKHGLVPRGFIRTRDAIPGRFIVVVDDARSMDAVRRAIGASGGRIDHRYSSALHGFAVSLDALDARTLADEPGVTFVSQDSAVTTDSAAQLNPPWGLDRIDQQDLPVDGSFTHTADASGVTAYVIDSGILLSHSEFTGRITSGLDAVDGGTADDCNGHGTHVAGTIGGTTYGVAKDVQIVAVRVIGCGGSGTTSDTIEGIDWVTSDHLAGQPAVANMSLASDQDPALETAVSNSIADGITYVASAGNNGTDACHQSPASVPAALTIAASDAADSRASFSNFGSCVDLFAPGVDVLSAWYTGPSASQVLSGTSMAAPHVTGAAALYLATHPSATPAQVSDAIVGWATPGLVTDVKGSPNRLLYTGFDVGDGSTFVVTSAGDAGGACLSSCTLRAAIAAANAHTGPDRIFFDIPGSVPLTIAPTSQLPALTDPVVIDATTQPGGGDYRVLVTGANISGFPTGFNLTTGSSRSVIRGLVISSFGNGIYVWAGVTNARIEGNRIGSDVSGTSAAGNQEGVVVLGDSTTVGGRSPAAGNLISGNGTGVSLWSSQSEVIGNVIGTNASGSAPVPNTYGVDVVGDANRVGGARPGDPNLIASNTADGVYVGDARRVTIAQNSIDSNGGLGIDLDPNGVNMNDGGDADTGSNDRQNWPTLTSASVSGASTMLSGTLDSTPSSTFEIEFFASDSCDPTGSGEGATFLGSRSVSTGSSGGTTPFSALLIHKHPAVGSWITATATDALGNTSEFSQCRQLINQPPTLTVNTTDDIDDGFCDATHCSLREAIDAANAQPGPDQISFAIPGPAPYRIQPTAPLPSIVDPVTLDGSNQPGFSGTPLVEVNGALAGATSGLTIAAGGGGSMIRGVSVTRFRYAGVRVEPGAPGNTIVSNYLGVDPSGTAAAGNLEDGLVILSDDNTVGGTSPATRNVASANRFPGIRVIGASGNVIQGNYVGPDATGQASFPHSASNSGIAISGGWDNVVGGSQPGAGNLISGNGDGIEISGPASHGNAVIGNRIGPAASGGQSLGNDRGGVFLSVGAHDNTIGGTAAGEGNEIIGSGRAGVWVLDDTTIHNAISGNSITNSGGLGIELGQGQVVSNDAQDADVGPNALQNFPVITSATPSGSGTLISGTLSSAPNTTYRIEFFAEPTCDVSGFGEGSLYLGATNVTTNGAADATFNAIPVPGPVPSGHVVSATATDPAGNTSEFSATCPSFDLTVIRSGSGSGIIDSVPAGLNTCQATCHASFVGGTTVVVSAKPFPGFSTFTGWSGSGCSGTGTCKVTMTQARTVTATFSGIFQLSVATNGTGVGTVTSTPTGIDCGTVCSKGFADGTAVTLKAQAGATSIFTGWSGEGCTGTGTCSVAMTQARSVTATFAAASSTFPLTVTRAGSGGGTVTSSPASISCGSTCQAPFTAGSKVALTATPIATSVFSGWSGAGCSGTGKCTVTMSQARAVTATFNAVPTSFALSIARTGTGSGTITSSPAGIDCGSVCQASFATNATVTLMATPTSSSLFAGWSGGGCTGTAKCVVTMSQAISVTASFNLKTFALTVSKGGTGAGSVTSTPAGITCGSVCSAKFTIGTQVTLVATPNATSSFGGWTGACSGMGPCTVTMDAAQNVGVSFVRSALTLTVSKAGAGGGTVSSSPAGIDCGTKCQSNFSLGTVVTLTATPNATSNFAGWSGACTGTGSCSVSMDQNRTVTATFVKKMFTLTVTRSGSGGGTVSSKPAAISCGSTCSASFIVGTQVQLEAASDATSVFTGWTGACTGLATCVVTIDQARSVDAGFRSLSTRYTDDFNGSALGGAWNATIATTGVRWCPSTQTNHLSVSGQWQDVGSVPCHGVVASPPHGSVTVANGLASLAAGARLTAPYIWMGQPSRPSPFPTAGDFALAVRLKFPSIAGNGTEFNVGDWPNTDPTGDNPPGRSIFSIGACSGCGLVARLLDNSVTVGSANAFHTYRLEYVGGSYSLWVDGVRKIGPVAEARRPDSLWVGNPVVTFWGTSDWTDLTLDSLAILADQTTTPPTWVSKPPMLAGRFNTGAATSPSGRIYAFGGYDGVGALSSVEMYDPAQNAWSARASMPTSRRAFAVATASNGKMYLFGGFTPANYASDVDEYSPGTDTWATVSQMPTPRSDLGAVEAGGSIYAIGGASAAASPDGTVEAYDPATDVWTAKAPMLTPRSHFAYAKGADGRIYAISGLTGTSFGNATNVVEAYDPASNSWFTVAPIPTPRASAAAVLGPDGRIYVIGGFFGGNFLTTVESYDPVTNTWRTEPSLGAGREGLAATVGNDGTLYALGGEQSGNALKVVESLSP